MKDLLLKYAQYNVWANDLLIDVLLGLSEQQLDQEIVSSFPSIRKTVYHTWSAEHIWFQRLSLVEHPTWMEGGFFGTFSEACHNWKAASADLQHFTANLYDEKALTHEFMYYDLKKNPHKTPVNQTLLHVFNHSTNHRGQLITMLRQAGVKKIPQTDFIAFVRLKHS